MVKTADIAGVSASRIAAIAAVLLAGLINSACSTSGLGGRSAGGTGFVEGALGPARNTTSPAMSAVDGPGVDAIETGAIGPTGVFGSVAIPIRNFPVSMRWERVNRGIQECLPAGACGGTDRLLERIATETEGRTTVEKLRIVNSMINSAIRYRSDRSLYGELDHWATPSEILLYASGDCEDFAILKMMALIRAGLPPQSLSLVVLRDNGRGVFHAVLAVATSSGTFILDNNRAEVAMDADLPNYLPLFSLSEARAWIHATKAAKGPAFAQEGSLASVAPGEGVD